MGMGKSLAACQLGHRHALFASGVFATDAKDRCGFEIVSKPKVGIFPFLGYRLYAFTHLEFQHGALERKFSL
jgi:hypothetical protein